MAILKVDKRVGKARQKLNTFEKILDKTQTALIVPPL
jgi:hypothetical protein